ncbi:hypothetical protein AB0N16_11875 [Streptomyces sp. NPDC051105]|uniref:hypothetical protein n=1 Tax=Streptomyces sp. NPDC051105 TaxID=3154843 RepID=UPI003412D2B3
MKDLLGRAHGVAPAPQAGWDPGFPDGRCRGTQGADLNVFAVRHGVLGGLSGPRVLEDVEGQDWVGLVPRLGEGSGIGAVSCVSPFADLAGAVVEGLAQGAVSFASVTRESP